MKRVLYILLVVFAISCNDSRKEEGNKIVEEIFEFEEENGRYPNSLNEIGIEEKEEGPFYYERSADSLNFKLWYGLGLGDSEVYQSKTKSWYGPESN